MEEYNDLCFSIPFTGVAAAYVRKAGKQAGEFLRKIRNCKSYSDISFLD